MYVIFFLEFIEICLYFMLDCLGEGGGLIFSFSIVSLSAAESDSIEDLWFVLGLF